MRFDKLAERRILQAQAEGQLENLKGFGKPLGDDGGAQTADAAGYRIMAEAGALPEEIKLKKQIAPLREQLAAAQGDERRAVQRQLADLEMRYAIAQEARRKFARD